MMNRPSAIVFSLVLIGALLAVFYERRPQTLRTTTVGEGQGSVLRGDEANASRIEQLRQRLQPRQLQFDENGVALPHQLLHLHHMKTGGTSTDMLLRCSLQHHFNSSQQVPYNSIHECGATKYQNCISGKDQKCLERADHAAVMSYCAPLADLPIFGWKDVPHVSQGLFVRYPRERAKTDLTILAPSIS